MLSDYSITYNNKYLNNGSYKLRYALLIIKYFDKKASTRNQKLTVKTKTLYLISIQQLI